MWSIWAAGAAAIHLVLVEIGFSGLVCPVRELTGASCPGCGLTSATWHLLRGEWREALTLHLFAPIFAAAFLVVAGAGLLSNKARRRTGAVVREWEQRSGAGLLFAGALLVYWLLRAS